MRRDRKVKTVGCKVTLEQFAAITKLAATRDQFVGEWVRDILLASLAPQQFDPKTELLLSEMASIRVSMITLMQHAINGTRITDSDLDAVIEDSDKARFTIAANRFREGMKTLTPVLKNGLPQ